MSIISSTCRWLPIRIVVCHLAFAACLVAQSTTPVPPAEDVLQSLRLPTRERQLAARNAALKAPSVEPLDLAAIARQLDARRQSYATTDYDLDACVATLPKDPAGAFGFVRDSVAFDVYPGLLRGAGLTFVARAGNTFDRAALLAEILRRQGHTVRYAIGKLGRAESERLLDRAFEAPKARKISAARTDRAQRFLDRLAARATRDYDTIQAALGDDGFAMDTPSREQLLAEVAEHCWVQLRVGEAWIDLDPSFADSQVGKAIGQVNSTASELPPECAQHISIRVIAEHLTEGKLIETRALETMFRSDQLLDQHVFLFHVAQKHLGATISGALSGESDAAWLPVLWVQEATHPGETVQFSAGGGAGGILDALGGGESSAGPQLVAEWLELEFTAPGRAPEVIRRALIDRAPVRWRATTPLDASRLAPFARDAEGLAAPQALHNLWLSAGGHNLAAHAAAMHGLVLAMAEAQASPIAGAAPAGATSDEPDFFSQVMPTALQNFTWLLWSDEFLVAALNDAPDQRFYADSPRVWIFSATPAPDGKSVTREMDLRRDRIRGIARNDSAAALLRDRQLWFGVLEGALEHEATAEQMAALGADTASLLSTSHLLDAEGAFVLRPRDADRVAEAIANTDLAGRARAALARGSTLVIPRGALKHKEGGWWEIDRAGQQVRPVASRELFYSTFNDGNVGGQRPGGSGTGGSYGVGPDGKSRQLKGPQQYDPAKRNLPKQTRALSEYMALVINAVQNAHPFVKLGLAVGGAVAAAAAAAAVWP